MFPFSLLIPPPGILQEGIVVDAVKIDDGSQVLLKWVKTDALQLHEYLLFLDVKAAPMNHLIPVIDILRDFPNAHSEWSIVVMPLLRSCKELKLRSVGELVDMIRQILEVCSHGFELFV